MGKLFKNNILILLRKHKISSHLPVGVQFDFDLFQIQKHQRELKNPIKIIFFSIPSTSAIN
jgi:hypothetical protein